MAKIVVCSLSLTQPFLLYPGLGPAVLDNIGGVVHVISTDLNIEQLWRDPQDTSLSDFCPSKIE
jgi:hypothetical protein